MADLIGVGEHADPYAIHGVGTFMYMTGSFMGQMLVNIPAPWSIWVIHFSENYGDMAIETVT
jgi:hypothetical protein